MTLLEKALKIEEPKEIRNKTSSDNRELRDKCELMMAYRAGKVFAPQVAKVLNIEAKQVATYANGVLMMGVRHGILEIVWVKEK